MSRELMAIMKMIDTNLSLNIGTSTSIGLILDMIRVNYPNSMASRKTSFCTIYSFEFHQSDKNSHYNLAFE